MNGFDAETVTLDGKHLVEASAGTGKTHAIGTLYVRLLTETELTIRQILVVTFTEAATAELRERLRSRLQLRVGELAGTLDEVELVHRRRLIDALADFDGAAIHTIHAFCHRLLRERSFEMGVAFDAELLREAKQLREDVLTDYLVREFGGGVAGMDGLAPPKELAKFEKLVRDPLAHARIEIEPKPGAAARLAEEIAEARPLYDRDRVLGVLREKVNQGGSHSSRLSTVEMLLAGEPVSEARLRSLPKLALSALRANLKPGVDDLDDPFLRRVAGLSSAALDADPVVELVHRAVAFCRTEEERRKRESGALTFDDLLTLVHRAVVGRPDTARALGESYGAALIDEFQDTDPQQFEIFTKLFDRPDARVFWVGDPKQAIYAFRGADVFAYLKARDEPGVTLHTMTTNWRSDPCVLRGVNTMFRGVLPFVLPQIGHIEVQPRPGAVDTLRIGSGSTEPDRVGVDIVHVEEGGAPMTRMARATAQEIVELLEAPAYLDERRVRPGDIAVLTRSNDEVFAVHRELARVGVPAVALADQSVFESVEATELLDLLVAIEEPTSGAKLKRALITPLIACSAAQLARDARDEGTESTEFVAWADRVRRWSELWLRAGFIQMMRDVVDGEGRRERLLAEVDGERRLTNLLHLTELLHARARADRLGPAGVVHWLRQQIAAGDRTVEAHLVRLESDSSVVQVTTMHRAKGLEYGVVYCPFLLGKVIADGVFHRGDDLVCDVRSRARLRPEQTLRAQQIEALSEDLRLLYVGLTRAAHRVVVLTTEPSSVKSAWFYLLDRPDIRAVALPLDAFIGKVGEVLARTQPKLAAWCAESEGAIRTRRMVQIPDRKWAPPTAETSDLIARDLPADLGAAARRRSSFTALVAAAESSHRSSAVEDEATVVDESAEGATGARVVLADFPRGTRAGLAVHEVFERAHEIGFEAVADGDPAAFRMPIERELRRHGIDPVEHLDALQAAVVRTLTAELVPGLRLCETRDEQREAEIEFHVPFGIEDPATVGDLAAAMAVDADSDNPREALPGHYIESLGRLQFADLRGFLRGFIDLVFAHDGRYYVLDWKSNFLGEAASDYGSDGLARAMTHGHYHLQSHLYSLALHRLLQWRLDGYDYDRHFGGAIYVFVRGVTGEPGDGVHFERPPRPRLRALETLCGGECLVERVL